MKDTGVTSRVTWDVGEGEFLGEMRLDTNTPSLLSWSESPKQKTRTAITPSRPPPACGGLADGHCLVCMPPLI